jgi:hypothetical protein
MATKIKLGTSGNWGVKEGGTLAYNDENGVFKAIELASSRSSGATYVGEDGLIKDAEVGVPRIDWTNGVGELLLEPQSTNLITYSNDFTQWNESNLTKEVNNSIGLDGQLTATKLTASATSSQKDIRFLGMPTSAATRTFSLFFKNINNTQAIQFAHSGDLQGYARFDVVNNTVGSVGSKTTAKIDNYGNGWYRLSATFDSSNSFGSSLLLLVSDSAIGGYGGSSSTACEFLIWGGQYENLSYPTSLIKTSGSQVTRIADAVTGNSSLGQVINSSEGTLYFNFRTLTQIPSASNYVSLSNGTTSDSVFFQFRNDGNLRIYHKALGGSDIAFIVAGNDYSSQYYKAAYTWNNSTNTSNLFVNGVKQTLNGGFVYTDISALDKLSLDLGTSGSDFRGRAREIKVYDTALTDAELTTLTTI